MRCRRRVRRRRHGCRRRSRAKEQSYAVRAGLRYLPASDARDAFAEQHRARRASAADVLNGEVVRRQVGHRGRWRVMTTARCCVVDHAFRRVQRLEWRQR